ncbi:disulfide bond formation protein B [Shinella sumterensis]|uniref:Disulfide bond formation protein DsbB n=1 Tax=Rhizobium subbaraonis TaxID=908946 RepID=A0A285USS4_9HYPH|nr:MULTISPECIES: disulfide bond formation protein B [Rhizobiaceae]MCW5711753.1 disulfide bond formation protein B [Shinella sp.]WLS08796.1 disulfide bond formation protein B [Shinella sumterensis]SOC44872.1 disulfide bond formation protein DsbB [Rhizobium subbaraonis]
MNTPDTRQREHGWLQIFVAWMIALASSLGALFIGEVMGQTPCLLCWYQRAFMFPLALVLAVAAIRADRDAWIYGLPLSASGLSIALYHVLLYYGFISQAVVPCGQGPSCTDAKMTIFDVLPLPVLSVLAFAAISILLFAARRKNAP